MPKLAGKWAKGHVLRAEILRGGKAVKLHAHVTKVGASYARIAAKRFAGIVPSPGDPIVVWWGPGFSDGNRGVVALYVGGRQVFP